MAKSRATAKSRAPAPRWIWQRAEWPRFAWDSAALSAASSRVRRAQGELAGGARLLDAHLDAHAELDVLVREGLATSAIEGETLDPGALRSSIAQRLGLPTAGLPRPSRSIDGLVEVLIDATRRHASALTLKRLYGWQAALFPAGRSGLHEIRVGKLRGPEPMRIVSGPIGHERVHYEAPPRERLNAEMQQFIRWFNAWKRDAAPAASPPVDGLVRAGLAHAWFEILHPFEDGNGRVGRALLDIALAQDEGRATRLYSMSARFMDQRDAYYTALERTSSGNLDVTPWLAWFLEQLDAAVRSSEGLVHTAFGKARFWMRHSQVEFNGRQRKALNRLLDVGLGGFVGGLTNKKYANLTKASAATAQRDLADLVAKGCLELVGSGRGARYDLIGVEQR